MRKALLAGTVLGLMFCVSPLKVMDVDAGVIVADDRSVEDVLKDTTIWTNIKKELLEKEFIDLLNTVHVQVTEGRVFVSGEVEYPEQIKEVLDVVWSIDGVKAVSNDLRVASENMSDADNKKYNEDILVSNKIKSKMLLDKGVTSNNYSIFVYQKEAYIFGVPSSQQELDKVYKMARSTKGVKAVKNRVRKIYQKVK